MENETKCKYCGASMKQYWHTLTPGVVKALIKFRGGVLTRGENKINLVRDLKGINELLPYELKNWTKVRFHGLATKYKVEGVWVRGYWLLTKRGNQFLQGKIEIPAKVLTFRNKVIQHDINKVSVHDVMRRLDLPEFESLGDIEYELADPEIEVEEMVQGKLL